MDVAMKQIRDRYAEANPREQQKILEELRDLQNDLHTPWEVLFGVAMGVSLPKDVSPMPTTDIRSASPMGAPADRHRS
jgi:hypothetical protein